MAHLDSRQRLHATHDRLTGLPNRLALAEAVGTPIRRCVEERPDAGLSALMVADVLRLGRVNEALGHRVGDLVLVAIAARLMSRAGPRAMVTRLHGDEFAIFMWGLPDADEVLARATALRTALDEPIWVDGQPLSVSVAIGVSLCPAHGTTLDELERRADTAMEQAKGVSQHLAIFEPEHDVTAADQVTLLTDLRSALEEPDGQIVAFYQPQVDMPTGALVGAEALLRWLHPTRGIVGPAQILRAAEHSPLMRKLSMLMLERVLAQLAAWQAEGLVLRASVNISVRDLHSAELVTWLDDRLRYHSVAPRHLQLELTESALMSQVPAVIDNLRYLRAVGVGAALDDFGTGYSSLQHLRQLPLTEIKIDRSFVQSMMESPRDRAIVRAVIDLGRDLGLRVVAEGVEDDRTRTRLLADGCALAQGWYYAAPMSAADFTRWCSRRKAHARSARAVS
jgi:diguanylate cyclase (GGDEF)-like protein